jgi:hypothetical protein
MKPITIQLDYCRGSNSGQAIYLRTEPVYAGCEPSTGHRVAGGKCWGWINTVKSFNLPIEDAEEMVDSLRDVIKKAKRVEKKLNTTVETRS